MRPRIYFPLALCLLCNMAVGDEDSIGPDGIRSSLLNLHGSGIAIGQIEGTRPGVLFFDNAFTHIDVAPTDIFRQNGPAVINDSGLHGLQVAGVMIATDGVGIPGVADEADLYASAYIAAGAGDEDIVKTIQHVASRNGGDVRAINHSYGETFADGDDPVDGSSYLTMGIDWSASAHDVLHVKSGDEGHQRPLPMDNYNGITVGASERVNGTFSKVAQLNFFSYTDFERGFNDLIAPGDDIDVAGDADGIIQDQDGTSLAAPHVTGTVALLQEFVDDKITNVGGMHWTGSAGSANANRHEVMKAVLLNSADKLAGVHGSTRTVESHILHGNYDWTGSEAATDESIPLDYQFGAGHLNAQRAVTQLENGEWDPNPDFPIPNIGWDLGETGGPGTTLRYPLAEPLAEGQYISATLAWDRFIDKTGDEDSFTPGDMFFATGLNDLDLFLLPSGWVDYAAEAIPLLYSNSVTENVEHVFAQIPTSGNYEVVVVHSPGAIETDQEFGLAWWYGNPAPPVQDGDFNADGAVNGRDFLAWQRGESPTPFSSADLADWQTNYGAGSLAATIVPEPTSALLTALVVMGIVLRRNQTAV